MEMKHVETGTGGKFVVEINGEEAGFIQYSWMDKGQINANGTLVHEAYRDQKLGMPLFNRLIAFAKEKGIKIYPTCPFVVKTFARHPELSDLLADDYRPGA